MRIGHGRDIHRFILNGKPLILGGISIPYEKGIDAHSDGDVLLHALSESILGALALGDLGTYFPEDDKHYENLDSKVILNKALEMMKERKYHLVNVDIDFITQKPHLRKYILEIRTSLSKLLSCDISQVSLKAQTNEGLDSIGKEEAIECDCILLLEEDYLLK